jgi:hypothetical protein
MIIWPNFCSNFGGGLVMTTISESIDKHHEPVINMQKLASFVILLVMSPVLLVLVVVSTTYLLRFFLP